MNALMPVYSHTNECSQYQYIDIPMTTQSTIQSYPTEYPQYWYIKLSQRIPTELVYKVIPMNTHSTGI